MPPLYRFRLRGPLVIITVVTCLLGTADRLWRIHTAALFVESLGGDVWCSGIVYSDPDYHSDPDRGTAKCLPFAAQRTQARIATKILTGTGTELWLCCVPENRTQFANSIAILAPKKLTFDVLGPKDLQWVRTRFPNTKVVSCCGLDDRRKRREPTRLDAPNADADAASTPQTPSEGFAETVTMMAKWRAEHPKAAYRLDRYEVIIGSPPDGAMGMTRDTRTGRVIVIPWPR